MTMGEYETSDHRVTMHSEGEAFGVFVVHTVCMHEMLWFEEDLVGVWEGQRIQDIFCDCDHEWIEFVHGIVSLSFDYTSDTVKK